MFNQAKLQLRPSFRVAILLSIPCIATLILILSADIPVIFTISFCLIHTYVSYVFIANIALLSSTNSIQSIEVADNKIYLEDKSGRRFLAQLYGKNILFPTFSLLSFKCEELKNISTSSPRSNENSSKIIISDTETRFLARTSHFPILRSKLLLEKIHTFKKDRFLSKSKRHLFICRYNATNPTAFRRIRIWLKFND